MKYRAGFIGTGNMGGALLEAASRAIGGENIALFDVSKEKAQTMAEKTGASYLPLDVLCRECRYVFLGVKPNIIMSVIAEIKSQITADTVLVSMAAGVAVREIAAAAGSERVIRIMPNTPSAVGEGMILYCTGADVTGVDVDGFLEIMKLAGKVDPIDEKLIDAAAALSGCGPAFVYMFIEALADGAVACGLPRDKAMAYAVQTVMGSAAMAEKSGKHPGKLKDEVCSPGGTTIEGVLTLENGAFRSTVSKAVISAYEKTAKLKK